MHLDVEQLRARPVQISLYKQHHDLTGLCHQPLESSLGVSENTFERVEGML
jgi:hypothetical protein